MNLYRFTQAGIFLALTWPGFFLSTRLGSLVTQPAVENHGLASESEQNLVSRKGRHDEHK